MQGLSGPTRFVRFLFFLLPPAPLLKTYIKNLVFLLLPRTPIKYVTGGYRADLLDWSEYYFTFPLPPPPLYYTVTSCVFLPIGTFWLPHRSAGLGAAGLGRRGIGLGMRLEVPFSPEPYGRHGAFAQSKKSSHMHRVPRPDSPSRAGSVKSALRACNYP